MSPSLVRQYHKLEQLRGCLDYNERQSTAAVVQSLDPDDKVTIFKDFGIKR